MKKGRHKSKASQNFVRDPAKADAKHGSKTDSNQSPRADAKKNVRPVPDHNFTTDANQIQPPAPAVVASDDNLAPVANQNFKPGVNHNLELDANQDLSPDADWNFTQDSNHDVNQNLSADSREAVLPDLPTPNAGLPDADENLTPITNVRPVEVNPTAVSPMAVNQTIASQTVVIPTAQEEKTLVKQEISRKEEKPRMTRILLVEDSKFLRLTTERALARAGYEVSTAVDGESALRVAREKMPDIVLLDMLLPKVTGPDVLKALKGDPATAGINIVVLTSMSPKNADRLRKDGACAFLSKDELNLDRSCEALLRALVDIVKRLNLTIPTAQLAAAK